MKKSKITFSKKNVKPKEKKKRLNVKKNPTDPDHFFSSCIVPVIRDRNRKHRVPSREQK